MVDYIAEVRKVLTVHAGYDKTKADLPETLNPVHFQAICKEMVAHIVLLKILLP
jgi:hypothetical protein